MIWIVLGTIGIIAAMIAVGFVLDRRFGVLPRPNELRDSARQPRPTYAAGDAPSTAIRATAERLANLRESKRCTECRGPASLESEERVRYDERELIVLRFRCTHCNEARSLYVDPG
jgi:hypothetical protein